jgi:hypothetical protein
MGKKILNIGIIVLAAYGAIEGVKDIRARIQARKAIASAPSTTT